LKKGQGKSMQPFFLLWLGASAGGVEMSMAPVGGLPEAYYAIEIGGKLVGYAACIPAGKREWNGQEVDVLRSETVLRLKMLGQEKEVVLRSETYLQAGTLRPVFYHLTLQQGEASREVECEFTPERVRMWSFAPGADRGQPQEKEWGPDKVLLDGNNLVHLALLARSLPALDQEVTFTAYVPSGPLMEETTLTPAPPEPLAGPGGTRSWAVLESQKEGLKLYLDPESRTLVQVVVPGQEAVIRLTDGNILKLVEKMQAEEVLDRHFCQSNVVFDSFLDLTYVKADIDVKVIGEGITNPPSVLTNAMQTFSGRKEQDRITGTLTVRTRTYTGEGAPPLPYAGPDREKVEAFLQPSPLIESDDPAIVAQAREIVQGTPDSWEATRRVAQWVHDHLSYQIADSPSARLALQTRRGDCGPHSTLTIAMLRAVGVPARLVGGLCYSPSFGGSWGQHGWVEVYQGPKSGWVPVDPTTGEYDHINAGHLKLFEGLGGVLPTSVQVTEFEPPNRIHPTPPPRQAQGWPWELDRPYRYRYSQGGQSLGTETFTLTQVDYQGQVAYRVESRLELRVEGQAIAGTQSLTVNALAQPLEFHADMNAAGTAYQIDCIFQAGQVKTHIRQAGTDLQKDITLPEGLYCFDNNFLGAWAVICPQLTWRVGEKVHIGTYHPSSTQQVPLTFEVQGLETVSLGGTEVECFKCFLPRIQNTFWITPEGRLVKCQQGPFVLELETP